jgi:AraC-like DNA-binding protein
MLGEVAQFSMAGVGRLAGTLTRLANTPDGNAVEGRDEFAFGINQAASPMIQRQRGRELVQAPGEPGLISNADAGEIVGGPVSDWCSVILPSTPLRELVRDVDDLVAREIDPGKPAMKYFRRYVALLLQPDGIEDDPLLVDHVSTTLLDLVALCLDTGRDGAEIANMRGVRAARLQLAFAEIREGFADPGFSVERVAQKIGLSPRRVQGLLHEAGSSFTERVLELRLQRARSILTSLRHKGLKVSELALTSGFNDISYFNRRFRQRFGCSPTQYRNTDLNES